MQDYKRMLELEAIEEIASKAAAIPLYTGVVCLSANHLKVADGFVYPEPLDHASGIEGK